MHCGIYPWFMLLISQIIFLLDCREKMGKLIQRYNPSFYKIFIFQSGLFIDVLATSPRMMINNFFSRKLFKEIYLQNILNFGFSFIRNKHIICNLKNSILIFPLTFASFCLLSYIYYWNEMKINDIQKKIPNETFLSLIRNLWTRVKVSNLANKQKS